MVDQIRSSREGLTVKAYRGDGAALLAFDFDEDGVEDLAGFAVRHTAPSGRESWVLNRLAFDRGITSETTPTQRRWSPSNVAPLQKFHWTHFPVDVESGLHTYRTTAMLFADGVGRKLEEGPSVELSLPIREDEFADFEFGFTRAYVSSQAYRDRFGNARLRPTPKTLEFDTGPYEQQYTWLGAHARELLFRFLDECIGDPAVTVDCFAYDLDEPDFVRALERLGSRLRIFLDDAPLHAEEGALEPQVRARLEASAGRENVATGHFRRFAHNKVLIQRRDGRPVKVLTGSANFSVRGLYVQANNVLLFNDPTTAELYERAFQQAWDDAAAFPVSGVAGRWFARSRRGLPRFSVSFAPHATADVSLDRVADAIARADSSVFFAVMELGGTGRVLEQLRVLAAEGRVFSYGMTQRSNGSLTLVRGGRRRGDLVPFDYLSSKVPPPFREEWGGGRGQVVHHKFIVVDFNASEPVVFTGSSNLAAGGETANGDNLLAIRDRGVATAFAVEALRLVDHYRFRAAMRRATSVEPLRLKTRGERWWADAYRSGHLKETERLLFVS